MRRRNVLPARLDESRYATDSSPHTLRKLVRAWPLAEQVAFVEREVGVPLAEEVESAKPFPVSQRTRDVRDGLLALARRRGCSPRRAWWTSCRRPRRAGRGRFPVHTPRLQRAVGAQRVARADPRGGAAAGAAAGANAGAPPRLAVRWTAHDDAAWDARLPAGGPPAVATVVRAEMPERLAVVGGRGLQEGRGHRRLGEPGRGGLAQAGERAAGVG